MDTVLSILVLAAIALLLGAFVLWRKGGALKQVTLMVVLAVVMIVNVLIWTVPAADGVSPFEQAETLPD